MGQIMGSSKVILETVSFLSCDEMSSPSLSPRTLMLAPPCPSDCSETVTAMSKRTLLGSLKLAPCPKRFFLLALSKPNCGDTMAPVSFCCASLIPSAICVIASDTNSFKFIMFSLWLSTFLPKGNRFGKEDCLWL